MAVSGFRGQRSMQNFLVDRNERLLSAYSALQSLIAEHYGIEQTVLAGGYGYRQILELVQNGADAILEAEQERAGNSAAANRIDVLLRDHYLYVANTGAPLSAEGLHALLGSHSSPKRGVEIGRFGLGFKSLLRLGGRIDLFTATSGAIRFDPERCQTELKAKFGVAEAPGLRMAWPLPENERQADQSLGQLDWAETIVRCEIRGDELLEHLRRELAAFPAEFLLFFPVAARLVLNDGTEHARELRIEPDGADCRLHDGDKSARWRVARRDTEVTDACALGDATHIHARTPVPLAWAVPLDGRREEAGRFWAFFPTHTPTYLPGILNAPWKLNNDRNAIIGGEWNWFLMAAVADLIADTMWTLSRPDDPGAPLDAFPRQPERKDEDAAPLLEALWSRLENAAVIPNGAGSPRPARELHRYPRGNPELARQWQRLADAQQSALMVHPSCLERQRGSRLRALAERLEERGDENEALPDLGERDAASWFNAVASTSVAQAIQVLRLVEAFADDCKAFEWNSIRPQLCIIPTEKGTLVRPGQAILAPAGVSVPTRQTVAQKLYEDDDAKGILTDVLGVRPLDNAVWESVLRDSLNIPNWPEAARDSGWNAFWQRLRQAPAAVATAFAQRSAARIRVRRRDGTWVLRDEALLPGVLVSAAGDSPNQAFLVDPAMHKVDAALLCAIGIVDLPKGTIGPGRYEDVVQNSGLLSDWLRQCRAAYYTRFTNSALPNYLEPQALTMPKGWPLLTMLTGAGNAALSRHLLLAITDGQFVGDLKFGHSTAASYPTLNVHHPLPWLLLKHGTMQCGRMTCALAAIAVRLQEPALRAIPDWNLMQPAIAKIVDLWPPMPPSDDAIRTMWSALFGLVAESEPLNGTAVRDLCAAAGREGFVPDPVQTTNGEIPLSEVFVTSSPDLARRARGSGRVAVGLDAATLILWLKHGARNLAESLKPAWNEVTGPPDLVLTAFPGLAAVMRPEACQSAQCQQVQGLRLALGPTSEAVPCLLWNNVLLLDQQQLGALTRAKRLAQLVREIAAAGWLNSEPEEALDRLGSAEVDRLRAAVAGEPTPAARLL